MGREFRIGKLFHVTPLVDDLAAAEYFFDTVFSPVCMMRNYSPHWHRDAAIYVVRETSIEPMQCYGPREGEPASSWFRYQDRFGPRVHNVAFYVDDVAALDRRLTGAGVRTTNGGTDDSGTTFTHPKDTPGMLEFHEPLHWGARDPRFSEHFDAFAADYWGERHPLGVQRLSHITTVVRDVEAARAFYVDVLDGVPLDALPSTFADAESAYVMVGDETVMELAHPTRASSPIASDLERVGESVVGMTFTIRDLETASEHLALFDAPVLAITDRDLRLDPSKTWSCEYRFTTDVLAGDPRVG